MPQVDDLSRSLIAFKQSSTLVAVLEMSQQSWLAAGVLPGIDRHPLKNRPPDPATGLQLLERWRAQLATGSGRRRLASLLAGGLMAYRGSGRSAAGASVGAVIEPAGAAGDPAGGGAGAERGRAWKHSYRVRRGDTLEALAARHGTTIDAIRRHNELRSRQIQVGQTLRLPGVD